MIFHIDAAAVAAVATHINDSLFFIRMLYKDAYRRFMICISFVGISAFAWYFVAFCQRLIYEYMDMDMDGYAQNVCIY